MRRRSVTRKWQLALVTYWWERQTQAYEPTAHNMKAKNRPLLGQRWQQIRGAGRERLVHGLRAAFVSASGETVDDSTVAWVHCFKNKKTCRINWQGFKSL